MARALKIADKQIESLKVANYILTEDINRMRPKEIFADAVAASQNSILIGELAKILRQNGIDTGEKRLFNYLRQEGYLVRRKGTDYNMPMQRSMDMKLFEIRERIINNPDGSTRITKTVLVTGKGQEYFINKFLHNKV
jgi:anti-repressor protein